jgi:hypothetical protein
MTHLTHLALRRFVLGAALAAGLAAWLIAATPDVRATPADAPVRVAQADTGAPATEAAPPAGRTDTPAPPAKGGAEVTIDRHGIVIDKGEKRVRVGGFGHDREYESFDEFVRDAPWLAALVFLTVLLVFLVPLSVIVLLVWYKVRKNRMLNETMIKLAEKGVMPPAEAMDALATDRAAPALRTGSGSALHEHARSLRRHAAWSDLRKGVILAAVGVGLSAYSMLDDGTPHGFGLVLLFLGIGYCVLWYFEGREPATRAGSAPPPGSL